MKKIPYEAFSNTVPRLLIGLVLISNVEAGIEFFFSPARFAGSFEVPAFPGEIAVAGTGLLFLMWNVPYFFATVNPFKFKISLYEAVIMQSLGLLGETVLLLRISPVTHLLLRTSITRFIVFDGVGLVFLLIALLIINRIKITYS